MCIADRARRCERDLGPVVRAAGVRVLVEVERNHGRLAVTVATAREGAVHRHPEGQAALVVALDLQTRDFHT
jgi:hypothetical protein